MRIGEHDTHMEGQTPGSPRRARSGPVAIGNMYGRLVVLSRAPNTREGRASRAWWFCRCECGVERTIRDESLRTNQAKSCGCSRNVNAFDDLTGRRFGSVVAMARVGKSSQNMHRYRIKCDCSRERVVTSNYLRRATKCGKHCGKFDNQTKHPLYCVWSGIKDRCNRTTSEHYADYGGRGIRLHDTWLQSFPAFVAGVGERPPGMHNGRALYSLDRIDPNGHYEPGNVRWASQAEQCANKRLSRETVDRLLNEASGMSDPLSWLREQMLGGE